MEITEIHPGHFSTRLDFPDFSVLTQILSREVKYVWGIDHREVRSQWKDYKGTIFETGVLRGNTLVRNMSFEFLIETKNFINLIQGVNRAIHLVQVDSLPPAHLRFDKLKGGGKYHVLKTQLNYFLEIEIPSASDYGYLISPNKDLIEKVILLK